MRHFIFSLFLLGFFAAAMTVNVQADASACSCKYCPTPYLSKSYVGGSGVGAWSGKFSGGGALFHIGYPVHHYAHGDVSVEFETGYIKETANSSATFGSTFAVGSKKSAFTLPNGKHLNTNLMSNKTDVRSRKATLEMVPLMLNVCYKINFDYWLQWKTPLVCLLGAGLGINIVTTKNDRVDDIYIRDVDGTLKFDHSVHTVEKRHNHCEFAGQLFTRIGWQCTPKCMIYTGARAFFTGEQNFDSNKYAGLSAQATHVLVDLGINYQF